MYPRQHVAQRADQPAVIMAGSGETVTYRELEARSNRLAHLLRAAGLKRLDHYAIFMENHPRFVECCAAGERSGLYYTAVNSFLNAVEVAYIVNNSLSKVLITSEAKREVALAALRDCPKVELCLIVDGPGAGERVRNLAEAMAEFPATPISDERLGAAMLYSSGTTGRPKGVLRPLPDQPPDEPLSALAARLNVWRFREGQVYLSPAPLYHSAPVAGVGGTIRRGGTVIVMERFDAEHFLQLVERHRVTHTQLVPTMFSRMLKLPEAVRCTYDLSSLEVAIHAAAPCPVAVKRAMIDWWGPIILEYYSATEAMGMTLCDSAEWLAHPGTVGKSVFGELHVLDDAMREVPAGETGKLWFKTASPFEYFNDPVKTAEVNSPDGAMSTLGDIGHVDEEGYVYLTDRATFMIISGGVNIYPQECENLLVTHPKVADAAVFGVPNEEMGEEVKAVVQLMPTFAPRAETEAELIAFCREHLAHQKCPRSIDFEAELPRLPTGKLYKASLRERYWKGRQSRIV
ncbi:MAG TPA: AMP-binding protein [Roseiarcus sp.]|jgi:long-chain acyl-CoA synthetase